MEKTKLLILRLTDRCNLRCKYCYASCSENADMSLETAQRAISLFAEPGDKLKLQFTGGEPLLFLELMEDIFRYVKAQGIQTSFSVQTNGTLLTEEVCEVLRKMRCAVGVSLDGVGTANGLRVFPDGTPALYAAAEGIRNLARCGMGCNLNAVVTSVNQHELPGLLDLAATLGGVRGVGLDMFRPLGRGQGENLTPCPDTLPRDIERMLEHREELLHLGVDIRVKELEKVRCMLTAEISDVPVYCYAQTGLSAAVDPRGRIYPCASLVGIDSMCMGSVYDERLRAAPSLDCDPRCASCPDVRICRGGCPAGRVALGGRSEADCAMHRAVIAYGRKKYAEISMPH